MNTLLHAISAKRKRKTPKKIKARNRERVESALRAILANDPDAEQSDGKPLASRDQIVDMMANLCHLAHREGIDARAAFETGWAHYEVEA